MQSRAADIYRISRVILVKNGWLFFYTGNKQGLSSSSSLYANRLLDILFCEFIGCVRSEAERHDGRAGASLALHSGSQARCLCCTVEPS